MQFKTQTDYAIKILMYLSTKKGKITRSEISKALNITENYLPKITTKLVRAGMITSYFGVAGGMSMLCSPSDITVWNVMEAMNDSVVVNDDLDESNYTICKNGGKNLVAIYSDFGDLAKKYFDSFSINDLINCNEKDKHN